MTKDARYLAALQAEQLKRVAERSFPAFVRQAWPILEPTTAFLPNWHIDLVCEYLEAVTAGEIRRLVINLPPRYGKSLLVSVLWPVWEWNPSSRDAVGLYELRRVARRAALPGPADPVAIALVLRALGVSGVVNGSHRGERVLERPARPDAGHLGRGRRHRQGGQPDRGG